jgi:hypothetical protein
MTQEKLLSPVRGFGVDCSRYASNKLFACGKKSCCPAFLVRLSSFGGVLRGVRKLLLSGVGVVSGGFVIAALN